ncbi:glycosyltransferase family 2 protein [Paracoccus sp. Ld10]|uniref:glycosyltransferase family 2 protein n=1 Tax=Paracoccus sp. Ld10 TaxID=649158 RepID=UPI00386DE589
MNSLSPDPSSRWKSNATRTIVTTVKNEGPFLLEWLCYHRLIGFNRFVIYSNDCTDGTHQMLQLLDQAGIVMHYDNSDMIAGLPDDPQRRAYARAIALPEVTESDWIAVLDGDEFFHVNTGDGTLDALFAALPDRTDAIAAQWRIFGNGGVIRFRDDLQIGQFTMASPKDVPLCNNQFAVKSLFRPLPVHRLGVHRPIFKGSFGTPVNPMLFVNGSGADITADFLRMRWSTTPAMAGYDLCHVNHYMIRASEVFLMKRWRGTANSADSDRINFDYYEKYNLNAVTETGITAWTDRVEQARAELIGLMPALGALHTEAVVQFRHQIDILSAQLLAEAPDQHARLFDPAILQAETTRRQAALTARRARLATIAAAPPPPPAAIPVRKVIPSAILLAPLLDGPPVPTMPLLSMTPWATLPDTPEPTPAEPPAPEVPPQWLIDLRRSPYRRGFYHSEEEFAALHVERERAHLFVSFDNLSQVGHDQIDREAWGYEFARKSGWSQLGIFAFRANWFRNDTLFAYLRQLRDNGLFARYQTVTFAGTSMGAYAACAFSAVAPGAQVIAFSPQSTLSPALVPWETRFPGGRAADWTGDFADAVDQTSTAGPVYLIYDPTEPADAAHADRFAGPNIVRLRTPLAGHKTALRLRQTNTLSQVVRGLATRTMDAQAFHALYRQSRLQPWYLDALGQRLQARGRTDWLRRLSDIAGRNGRPGMAKALEARAASPAPHPS